MAEVDTWETTAGANGTGSLVPPDGWSEGMAPSSVNNTGREMMRAVRARWNDAQWFKRGSGTGASVTTYASATSITIAGDVTTEWHAGRPVRAVGTSTGTIYGIITSSSYGAPNTTVNFAWLSGSLSNETLAISLGIIGNGAGSAMRGGYQLIETLTASTSAALDFEKGLAVYDEFMILLNNLLLATDTANLLLRVKEGGSYQADGTDYSWTIALTALAPGATSGNVTYLSSNGGAGEIRLVSSGDDTVPISGQLLVNNPGAAGYKFLRGQLCAGESTGLTASRSSIIHGVYLTNTNAWTGIRLLASSGNLTSGSASLFGLRR